MSRDIGIAQSKYKFVWQDPDTYSSAGTNVQNKYDNWRVESQLYDVSSDSAETTNLADSDTETTCNFLALEDAHIAYTTDNGCCSVALIVSNTCQQELTVSNADTTNCLTTAEGESCTVTCTSGYYGDDETYT